MDDKLKIGIDFSLVSPALCIYDPSKSTYRFVSFFDEDDKDFFESTSNKFFYHKELFNIMELVPYSRDIRKDDYVTEQRTKMCSAKMISKLITDFIIDNVVVDSKPIIGIEGFSYGSISSSTLDLALYNSFLRYSLLNTFGDNCIVIISPTEGKRTLSGKGNSNKDVMIQSFIGNRLNDELLTVNPLWQYCNNNKSNLDFEHIKPIDDLVDSYAILKSI